MHISSQNDYEVINESRDFIGGTRHVIQSGIEEKRQLQQTAHDGSLQLHASNYSRRVRWLEVFGRLLNDLGQRAARVSISEVSSITVGSFAEMRRSGACLHRVRLFPAVKVHHKRRHFSCVLDRRQLVNRMRRACIVVGRSNAYTMGRPCSSNAKRRDRKLCNACTWSARKRTIAGIIYGGRYSTRFSRRASPTLCPT